MKYTLWPYQTLGDSENPPLIFLHGFLGSGRDWLRVVKKLGSRYFCVIPDLPGHGENTKMPVDSTLDFDVLNKGILALLDHLQLPYPHFVGYSLGGRAALYFAVHYPYRVASLLLESANPGLVKMEDRIARAAEDDRRAEAILLDGIETFVEQWYTMDLFQSLHTHPQLGEMMILRKANHPGWAAKVIRELSPGRQFPLWDRLPQLEMPVLFIAGSLDKKYTGIGEQLSARIQHAQFVVVPQAGHNIHFEQLETFVHLIRNFLNAADTISNDVKEMQMVTVYTKSQMNTSAEKLWGALEKFDLSYFRGFPHLVEGSGVGTTRKFDMGKGEIAERVEKYDAENMTLTYTVLYGPLPVQNYHATIKILPGEENSSELEWSAVFEPKDATEDEAREMIEGMFKMNIKALNKFHAQS